MEEQAASTDARWHYGNTTSQDWVEFDDGSFSGPISYKVAGIADGFVMLVVRVPPGVYSKPHVHETMEFLYVLEGSVRSNGVTMGAGDGFGSSAGARHDEFVTEAGVTVLTLVPRP